MTTYVLPPNLQWVGLAKETGGYGVAMTAPTSWIPVDGSTVKYVPTQNVITDQNLRGNMAADQAQIQGMRYDQLDYTTWLYTDTLFPHFLGICGRPDTVTGSADPYTHKTSLENGVDNVAAQPPSYTLFYFDGLTCWQIPGCVVAELKVTVAVDEAVTLAPTWMGLPATKMATPPTNTPSTTTPIPAWNSTISVAGTAVSTYSSVEIDLKRDTGAVNTLNASQAPLEVMAGALSVSGTFTGVYQGGTDFNMVDYLTNVQPTLTVKCSPIGDTVHYLQIQHSKVAFDQSTASGSNKWMEISSTIKGLANPTDALDGRVSPVQIQFLTPVSTAY